MSRIKTSPLPMVAFAANALVVVIVLAALYLAQDVFIPLTLSTLLAFLLAPLADWLEHRKFGRIPAVLTIGLLAFSIIGGFLWLVGREATKLASNIPQYQTEIVAKVESFTAMGSGTSKRLSNFVRAITDAVQGKAASQPPTTAPARPVDDLDLESTRQVAEQSRQEEEQLGSASNPIHTIETSTGQTSAQMALGTATAVLSPLTNVGLVIVFTLFMLLSRDDLRDRLIRVLSGGRYIVTTKAIDEASRRISSYILAQTIVNLVYGFCIGLGLWIIGLTLGGDQGFPNYALWGLLCTVLRFVPYVGPLIAGAFPVLLSLIVFPGFVVFLATALLFTLIELLSNNVIEPWLYGSSTGMSPMAIIVAAVFWTWMWGPVGLLLATPLTASLVVMGKYLPQLRPLTVLLGDKTPLPPFVSFYQRLLADDGPRAAKILEAAIDESDIETAADDVLLPTIRRIRRDRATEELGAPREHRLMQQITGMIDDVLTQHCEKLNAVAVSDDPPSKRSREGAGAAIPDASNAAQFDSGATEAEHSTSDCSQRVSQAIEHVEVSHVDDSDASRAQGRSNKEMAKSLRSFSESNTEQVEHFPVVGCTAHHESEEPVLKLLAYSLSEHGVDMRWTGTKALPTDVESWIEATAPKVIVISIVPLGGFTQAKYLCQRLHKRVPKAQIIVAYFGKLRSYDTMLVRFRRAGASYFTTSLSQTRIQITGLLNGADGRQRADVRADVAVQSRSVKRRDDEPRERISRVPPDGGTYITSSAIDPKDDVDDEIQDAHEPNESLKRIDRPALDRPVVDRPVVDRPVVDRPVVDRPVVDSGKTPSSSSSS